MTSSDTNIARTQVGKWNPGAVRRLVAALTPMNKLYFRSEVYPGGDYDVYRPTFRENVIGFDGHTGYVTAAVRAGVPIVPVVSIGGQETQLYLTRGVRLARALRLTNLARRLGRTDMLPVSFGFPFGPSAMLPVNMPLPSKIVTEVLKPVDVIAEYGPDPDPAVVDAHVRRMMQAALHRLARERRLPILG